MPRSELLRRIAKELPKTELHLHLDGSLPASFIASRALARGISCPPTSEIRSFLHKRKTRSKHKESGVGAGQNWGVFDYCNLFLQTFEEISEATKLVCNDLSLENVSYAEIRLCPSLHTKEGLMEAEAIRAVHEGIKSSNLEWGGGVIVCGLRSHDPLRTLGLARLSHESKHIGVVGFDIAGDEASFPLNRHEEALRFCRSVGLQTTVHAGEWPKDTGSLHNVRLALEMGVDRIGHGWTMVHDTELMDQVADAGICVEICMTSNVNEHIDGMVRNYASHPVREFFERGIRCALSSDNLLLSGTASRAASPSSELYRLLTVCGFSVDEAAVLLMRGPRSVFGVPKRKRKMGARDGEMCGIASFERWTERRIREVLSVASESNGIGEQGVHRDGP